MNYWYFLIVCDLRNNKFNYLYIKSFVHNLIWSLMQIKMVIESSKKITQSATKL